MQGLFARDKKNPGEGAGVSSRVTGRRHFFLVLAFLLTGFLSAGLVAFLAFMRTPFFRASAPVLPRLRAAHKHQLPASVALVIARALSYRFASHDGQYRRGVDSSVSITSFA